MEDLKDTCTLSTELHFIASQQLVLMTIVQNTRYGPVEIPTVYL
jgi:hypothetical protein